MRQKIAITVFGSRISSRLDCAESILLVTVENRSVLQRKELLMPQANVMERIQLLLQEGVTTLICGGLTNAHAGILADSNIQVVPWIRGEVEQVLASFVRGTLHKEEMKESSS